MQAFSDCLWRGFFTLMYRDLLTKRWFPNWYSSEGVISNVIRRSHQRKSSEGVVKGSHRRESSKKVNSELSSKEHWIEISHYLMYFLKTSRWGRDFIIGNNCSTWSMQMLILTNSLMNMAFSDDSLWWLPLRVVIKAVLTWNFPLPCVFSLNEQMRKGFYY